ncbi:hypothetical protein [Nostoc sp. NZL]|uniref:hypothetical protein n=1 Tax=Nostoc sp. NZL TaxID=2650612 RepID=UPI0018C5F871|nr:hypothetical protein [Nostoc sp. NZL]
MAIVKLDYSVLTLILTRSRPLEQVISCPVERLSLRTALGVPAGYGVFAERL